MSNSSSNFVGLVSFVGAGPGDPELLTIKAARIIGEADLVIYAGSLVSPLVLNYAKPDAVLRDSATLSLDQIHSLIREFAFRGAAIARVHTGDPSLYGALAEQIALLDADAIPWRIVPGVTAATAAAAAAGISFTLPETAQSLIITRIGGRTPMPYHEELASLASHQTSMAIYLAGHESSKVQAQLLRTLPPQTPVICVSRASWPDEIIAHTTLDQLVACVQSNNMGRQTIFLVLPHSELKANSRLYDQAFTHSFRKGHDHG